MTSPIEGMQGENGPVESDYEPMRPDDPDQGEEREPIALGNEQPDPKVKALLQEAGDAVVEAIERRVEPMGYTPVPEGGTITDQFMVHENERDPRRAKVTAGAADPHALLYIGTEYGKASLLQAFTDMDTALSWAAFTPDRRLWRVRVVTYDQPMVAVRIPEQLHLMTEDEAKTHHEMEDDDDY